MNPIPFCTAALSLCLAACASPTPTPSAADRSPVMCTQDVQQCPDGRFVGRTPPACAFVCAATSAPAPAVR